MNTAPKILTTALAAISIPLLLSCTSSPETAADPIDPDVYVAVMASLSQVDDDGQTRADSAREEVLREHGITAEQLLAFAERVGRDPSRMGMLADQIAAASDSIAALRRPPAEEVTTPETVSTRARPSVEAEEADKSRRTRLDSLRQEFERTRP